jgi:hypothetical protein
VELTVIQTVLSHSAEKAIKLKEINGNFPKVEDVEYENDKKTKKMKEYEGKKKRRKIYFIPT